MSEQRIQQEIRLAISKGNCRVFRNNTGTLRDQHGRPVTFGLCKGSADLIGWRTITVTPEMVGQQVAVFLSIEVKTATGRLRPEQQQWLDAVQAAGGIADVVRSVEDAQRLTTGDQGGIVSESPAMAAPNAPNQMKISTALQELIKELEASDQRLRDEVDGLIKTADQIIDRLNKITSDEE